MDAFAASESESLRCWYAVSATAVKAGSNAHLGSDPHMVDTQVKPR